MKMEPQMNADQCRRAMVLGPKSKGRFDLSPSISTLYDVTLRRASRGYMLGQWLAAGTAAPRCGGLV
jgi:hypothetical protein